MSLLILPHSQSIIASASAASGPNAERLIDGTLDSLWKGATGIPFTINFALSGAPASYVAVHDIRCTHPITRVDARWTTAGGTVTDTFQPPAISRGSFFFARAPITASALALVFTTGAVSTLRIGQVVAGVPFEAPSPRGLSVSDGPLVVENGNRKVVARLPRMTVSFDHPPSKTDPMSDFIASLNGVVPVSIVPEVGGKLACFGSLGATQEWGKNLGPFYSRRIQFEEQIRGLL